jgi:flavodoxin
MPSGETVVIYDTKFGNTAKIAEAIARGAGTAGSVVVLPVAEIVGGLGEKPDLLLLGGPTQSRGVSPGLRSFLVTLPATLRGVPSASFDTRYRGSTWIMGSAAAQVAKALGKAGGKLVAAPESFFIARGGRPELQTLETGELERAEAWGRTVGAAATPQG